MSVEGRTHWAVVLAVAVLFGACAPQPARPTSVAEASSASAVVDTFPHTFRLSNGVEWTLVRRERRFRSQSPALGTETEAVATFLEVEGITDAKLHQNVNYYLGPYLVFDQDWDGIAAAFANGEYPFDTADVAVVYLGHDLLQVEWRVESTGAYVSHWTRLVGVDLTNGNPLGTDSLFNDDREVAFSLNQRFEPLKQAWLKRVSEQYPDIADWAADAVRDMEYLPQYLDQVRFSERGLTFVMPNSVPHALAAYEIPEISVILEWADLAPFAWEDSLVWRFVPRPTP